MLSSNAVRQIPQLNMFIQNLAFLFLVSSGSLFWMYSLRVFLNGGCNLVYLHSFLTPEQGSLVSPFSDQWKRLVCHLKRQDLMNELKWVWLLYKRGWWSLHSVSFLTTDNVSGQVVCKHHFLLKQTSWFFFLKFPFEHYSPPPPNWNACHIFKLKPNYTFEYLSLCKVLYSVILRLL